MVGSWALPIVFKEEGAGGAAALPREGKGCRCESRTQAATGLVGTEAKRRSAWAVEGWQCYWKWNWGRRVVAGPKPKWFIAGKARYMLLYGGRLLKINWCVGWGCPYLCRKSLVCESLRTRGCGAAWVPVWLEHSQHVSSWPDAAWLPLPCPWSWCAYPAPRDVPVHTVIILQTVKITLHTSQKLAQRTCCWAQRISNCWKKKSVWLLFFLEPCAWKPSESSVQTFPWLAQRLGGVWFLQGRVFLPPAYLGCLFPVRPMRGLGLFLAATVDVLACPRHSKSCR